MRMAIGEPDSRAQKRRLMLTILLSLAALTAAADQPKNPPAPPGAAVQVNGQTLFVIHEGFYSFTPQDRARAVETRVLRLSRQPRSVIESVHISDAETTTDIVAGDLVLMTVTAADATAAHRDRKELATEDAGKIRMAAESLEHEFSVKSLITSALWALLFTALLVVFLKLLNYGFRALYKKWRSWQGTMIRSIRIQKLELLPAERITTLLILLSGVVQAGLIALALYFYVSLTFSLFPWTRGYANVLFGYILYPLRVVGSAAVAFVPNVFFIAVILVVAFYVTRFVRFVFRELERGTITLSGFYPDWAQPTYKIARLLIIAFTGVVIFPYLPGAKSPAFQGISIFLGLLFSLGSTSAVSNVVAGTVLTYTRAFQVGDRVKIGEAQGDVIAKSLLVTRIRTIKNEEVSVPNSMVLSSQIVNFSSGTGEQGLVLHTAVTIGYSSPWRKVHDLLVASALATPHIRKTPEPFVLQTSLDDFYVRYQLNACTDRPDLMAVTYSELHQNIQDKFNEGGVEIMSPHYNALRDGNATAIPGQYLPPGYSASPSGTRTPSSTEPAKQGGEDG